MPRRPTAPTPKLLELYESGLDLASVGKVVGISKQAVHERLKLAGYTPRPPISTRKYIDRDLLVDLYVHQELSLAEIADRLDFGTGKITGDLVHHGIQIRKPGGRSKYRTYFDELKKNNSVLIPWTRSTNPHPTLHKAAKRAGVKVSIKRASSSAVRVTCLKLVSPK